MTDEHFELDYEAEAEGSGSLQKAADKLTKAREALESCRKERQEYLDGWQRLRADIANQKKESESLEERARARVLEEILEELLPTLDSFDLAMQGEAWDAVAPAWRSGVEYIRASLVQTLERRGVRTFGAPGEVFSAQAYEAVGTLETDQYPEGSVAQVIRAGYAYGERIIRPAQVRVAATPGAV